MSEAREINVYTHDYKTQRVPGDFRPHAVPSDTPDPVQPPPDVAKEIQETLDEEAAVRDFESAPETVTEPGPESSENPSDENSSPSSSSETKTGSTEQPAETTTSEKLPEKSEQAPTPMPPTAGPTPTIPSFPPTPNPSPKLSSTVPPAL